MLVEAERLGIETRLLPHTGDHLVIRATYRHGVAIPLESDPLNSYRQPRSLLIHGLDPS